MGCSSIISLHPLLIWGWEAVAIQDRAILLRIWEGITLTSRMVASRETVATIKLISLMVLLFSVKFLFLF